jgi:hypothetical protein
VGQFTAAGGVPAQNIAIWDGAEWCGLGSSFDVLVSAVTFYNDTLHIGGAFTTIDGNSFNYIAKWTGGTYVDTCGNTSGMSENNLSGELNVYPNPAINSQIIIEFSAAGNEKLQINIFNTLGEKVLQEEKNMNNSKRISLNLSYFSEGIYLLTVKTDSKVFHGKFCIAK